MLSQEDQASLIENLCKGIEDYSAHFSNALKYCNTTWVMNI